jgi:hypothetical protein
MKKCKPVHLDYALEHSVRRILLPCKHRNVTTVAVKITTAYFPHHLPHRTMPYRPFHLYHDIFTASGHFQCVGIRRLTLLA